jgi:AcrR family transcriptional regulator
MRKNAGFIQECITEALILLMQKQPYDTITITALTKKAGVSRVSFYRKFMSKDDILLQKLETLGTDWWLQQTAQCDSHGYAYALIRHGQSIQHILSLLYQHDLRHLLLTNIMNTCGATPEDDTKSAYTKAVLAGSIFGLCDAWISRGMRETPDEIGTIFQGIDRMLVSKASSQSAQ